MLVDSIVAQAIFSKWQSDRSAIVGQKADPKRSACSYSKATSQNNSFYPNSKKQQSHVLYFQNFLLNLFELSPLLQHHQELTQP